MKVYIVYRWTESGVDWLVSAHTTREDAEGQAKIQMEDHIERVKRAKDLMRSERLDEIRDKIWAEYPEVFEDNFEEVKRLGIHERVQRTWAPILAEYGFDSWSQYDYALHWKPQFRIQELELEEVEMVE